MAVHWCNFVSGSECGEREGERQRERGGGGRQTETERETDRQRQRETERNKERGVGVGREMWVGERERFHHRVSKLGVGEGAEEECHVSKE